MILFKRFLGVFLILLLSPSEMAMAMDPENTLYMYLKDGRVVIRMRPEIAPLHVARIKELVRKGFYDGLTFHRVIDGFMAQTGDPKGNGTGGSGQNIPAEFTFQDGLIDLMGHGKNIIHVRGVTSMARSQDINSADSQFFIMFEDTPYLDRKYTAWGHIIEGMEYVDNIKRGSPSLNGTVSEPDKIIRLRIMADMEN